MITRIFEDENGRQWRVTKWGSSLIVNGHKKEGEILANIARSCARRLNIKCTKNGVPIEYVNEHRRIWYSIWSYGREVEEP